MRTHLVAAAFVAATMVAVSGAEAHRWGHVGLHVNWWPWWGYGPYWGAAAAPAVASDLAVVDTDVSPEGARILLDGKLIGTADDFDGFPDYLYLKPGRYTLELQLPGYASQKVELDAAAGSYYVIDDQLERVAGTHAAAWYERPTGGPVGRVFSPRVEETTPAPAATPSPAKAERPAHADEALRPELRAAPESQPVSAAVLQLSVTPKNASVYLDGEFLGTAAELAALERGVAVAPGTHRIEVVAPGHVQRSLEVQVEPGAEQQVVVELEPGGGQIDKEELN